MQQPKSWLESQTVIASLMTMGGVVISIAADPQTFTNAANCVSSFGGHEWAESITKIGKGIAVIAPVFAIIGRVKAGGIYTGKRLPGPNREDLTTRQRESSTQSEVINQTGAMVNQILETINRGVDSAQPSFPPNPDDEPTLSGF